MRTVLNAMTSPLRPVLDNGQYPSSCALPRHLSPETSLKGTQSALHQDVSCLPCRARQRFHQCAPRAAINILCEYLSTTAHQPSAELLRGHSVRIGSTNNPGAQRFAFKYSAHHRQGTRSNNRSVDIQGPKLLLFVHGDQLVY